MKKDKFLKSPFSPALIECCALCGKFLPNDNEKLDFYPHLQCTVHQKCLQRKRLNLKVLYK